MSQSDREDIHTMLAWVQLTILVVINKYVAAHLTEPPDLECDLPTQKLFLVSRSS